MASGKPMDRLICGDVGFGKTEVALRAAFIAAMAGAQVAVVVPTTLLARQHYRSFTERFAGLPLRDRAAVAAGRRQGGAARSRRSSPTARIDIVDRHACAARQGCAASPISASLIVDEEQHFGVAQKEKLKQLKADVHVLTLTATPIPRTLQLALSGRARDEHHRDAAGRPAGGAHLRHAVRSGGGPRGDPARARPRRADLLCRAAHRRSRRGARASCARSCPRSRSRWRMAAWRRPSSKT